MSSRFFDSRLSERHGAGFPSCNTELCRLPANRSDPGGYYAEIGVPPWATAEEIRSRVRQLYRRHHPDTGDRPDVDRLVRIKLIAEVLLDPEARSRYNATPPGKRLLDKVYRSELSALDFSGVDRETMRRMLHPTSPLPLTGPRWYDYLAVDRRSGDMLLAQHWYGCLTAAARLVGYRRLIKVLLHDGPPFYHSPTAVMAIPRCWRPSTGLAYALLVVVAGQRHPAWGPFFVGTVV